MAETACVLDILEKNEFITVDPVFEFDIELYKLKLTNVTDKATKEMAMEKIVQKLKSDNKYFVGSGNGNFILFTTTKEINKVINDFLNEDIECKQIHIETSFIPLINENINDVVIEKRPGYKDSYPNLVNVKLRNQRIKREENQDKKILELLNDIL